jgi:hypothetical protein
MAKYIDSEKLKGLIKSEYKKYADKSKQTYTALRYRYIADGLGIAEQIVDSIQQEQQEVDLLQEFDNFLEREHAYVNDDDVIAYDNGNTFNHTYDIYPVAKHFYHFGRNLIPYSVGDKIKWKCQDDGRVRTSTIKRIEISQTADNTEVTYFVTIKFKGVLTTASVCEEDII